MTPPDQDIPGDATPDVAERLRDPWDSLHAYAQVMDQETGGPVLYDAHRLTDGLQETVLSYMSDPPRLEDGSTAWLALLKPRQAGASLTAELGGYVKAAYSPGWEHDCIADTQKRAEYLHGRVHFTHERWPREVRSPTISAAERKQLTFKGVGGSMQVLSAERDSVGIGLSPDSLHGSEVPFWSDAGKVWTELAPSIRNRKNSLVVMESTAAPEGTPSVEFWRELCDTARRGQGRWVYAFFPFWDGKLNRRVWKAEDRPDLEELRLLEKYGPHGLTLDGLAFRRFTMSDDREIRRNPELFGVWYPFDDLSCWSGVVSGAIPRHALERHHHEADVEWRGPLMKFEPYEPHRAYVMGVDPTGYTGRDHASIQLLGGDSDGWKQAACYASAATTPEMLADIVCKLGEEYGKPMVVVESNGVGQALLALLSQRGYPNLFHEAKGRPGKVSTSKSQAQMIAWLTDALLDDLTLRDRDTVRQLGTYKQDKLVETDERLMVIRGGRPGRNRRERHHWDKVSALMMAVAGTRFVAVRSRRPEPQPVLQAGLFTDGWGEKAIEPHARVRVARHGRRR